MWRKILVATCLLWVLVDVEANRKKRASGSYAGSFSGAGSDGLGYMGNYNDYDDGFASDFDFGLEFMDPYKFHQQLTSQILAQNAAHQNAIASAITTGDAVVTAEASNLSNGLQELNDLIQRQQAAFFDHGRHQTHYSGNSKDGKGNHYAPNYAAAAASFGPKGGYQTAFIKPENPAIPNINTRFGSNSPNGFKGVSVSSYSSSSNINGKESNYRAAQTTINDNGRITTYKVES